VSTRGSSPSSSPARWASRRECATNDETCA
jgi:hypothetical protein